MELQPHCTWQGCRGWRLSLHDSRTEGETFGIQGAPAELKELVRGICERSVLCGCVTEGHTLRGSQTMSWRLDVQDQHASSSGDGRFWGTDFSQAASSLCVRAPIPLMTFSLPRPHLRSCHSGVRFQHKNI